MAQRLTDPTSSCCTAETQATCCGPADKTACCATSAAGGSCGCAAGQPEAVNKRETVRETYAAAARAVSDHSNASCCGPASTSADTSAYTGCIAGALTREQFTDALTNAGLVDVGLNETHRVHAQAASAIIRARKPRTTAN